jgi:hypothetical protein
MNIIKQIKTRKKRPLEQTVHHQAFASSNMNI